MLITTFQLVKGTQLSSGSVYAHVAGGAALIRNWFPMRRVPCRGVRPLLQLSYSIVSSLGKAGLRGQLTCSSS